MIQYKEVDLGKFIPTKNEYEMAVPFVIAFVYSKQGNFIIKGMQSVVEKEISKYAPCHFNISYWNKQHSRKGKPFATSWGAELKGCKRDLRIEKDRKHHEKRKYYNMYYFDNGTYSFGSKKIVVGRWRKMPHKYIEELTDLNLMLMLDN